MSSIFAGRIGVFDFQKRWLKFIAAREYLIKYKNVLIQKTINFEAPILVQNLFCKGLECKIYFAFSQD